MSKKTKIVLISIFSIILIFIAIFTIFNYKNDKSGNTIINQSEEGIIDYILNISNYEATLDITVETNKNTNKYKIKQSLNGKISRQEVMEPSNIAGVITEYDGENLKVINSQLNLEKTFQNYNYIIDNKLWLDSFIKDYQKYSNSKVTIEDDEVILEVKDEDDKKYNVYKKLYIDKKTGKPTKMIVQDINQKTLVYILYTEIKIL